MCVCVWNVKQRKNKTYFDNFLSKLIALIIVNENNNNKNGNVRFIESIFFIQLKFHVQINIKLCSSSSSPSTPLPFFTIKKTDSLAITLCLRFIDLKILRYIKKSKWASSKRFSDSLAPVTYLHEYKMKNFRVKNKNKNYNYVYILHHAINRNE